MSALERIEEAVQTVPGTWAPAPTGAPTVLLPRPARTRSVVYSVALIGGIAAGEIVWLTAIGYGLFRLLG